MTNEDAIELTLGAKPDDLCAELCRYAPSTGHMHTLLGDHILVTAERLTGTALLTVAELRGLEPGDCILFSQAATEGQWAILAENHVFIFEAGENGWVCGPVRSFNSLTDNKKSGAPMTNDGNLPLPAEGSGQDDEALAVGPLEISVTFSLGSTRLPISEIESWQSGAVVALPEEISASDTKVTVNANGLPVAQGDLVRIDDRLAVRLNRILLSPSRQDG
ncbi:MAG: FliM/FliN family flagellar motor switch protein, partial [Roseibium sp.]